MRQVYDLVEAIEEGMRRFLVETDRTPTQLGVSPTSYRMLMEIYSQADGLEGLIIGHAALRELRTEMGTVAVQIDEMLPDTSIAIG